MFLNIGILGHQNEKIILTRLFEVVPIINIKIRSNETFFAAINRRRFNRSSLHTYTKLELTSLITDIKFVVVD